MEIGVLISYGLSMMEDMDRKNKEALKKCFSDWELSKQMPRKKKKQFRKDINLRYSFFKYYEDNFSFMQQF